MNQLLKFIQKHPSAIIGIIFLIIFLFQKLLKSEIFPELYIKNTILVVVGFIAIALVITRKKYQNWVKINYTQTTAEVIDLVDQGWMNQVNKTNTSIEFYSRKKASIPKVKFIDSNSNQLVEKIALIPSFGQTIGDRIAILFLQKDDDYHIISNSLFIRHGEKIILIFGTITIWLINFGWKIS